MGGGAPASPPQFNPQQAINAQQGANINTAIGNAWMGNTNQVTPYGSLNYQQTDSRDVGNGYSVPVFTATQTLSPDEQKIQSMLFGLQQGSLGTANNVLGQVNNAINTPLNFDGLPQMPTDQSAFRDQAYNALTSRSSQDINRQMEAQKVQLANQGISYGTPAYEAALRPFEQATVDASNQATINAGNLAGQNLSQAQTLRNQGITERTAARNQPLLDYQSLLGLSGGITPSQWAPGSQGQIAPVDATSPYLAQYQGQVNAYNQQYGASNAMMGGLFGLGGSVLGGLARAPGVQKFMGLGG